VAGWGSGRLGVPAGTAATGVHFGPYTGLRERIRAIRGLVADPRHRRRANWEIYGHGGGRVEKRPASIARRCCLCDAGVNRELILVRL